MNTLALAADPGINGTAALAIVGVAVIIAGVVYVAIVVLYVVGWALAAAARDGVRRLRRPPVREIHPVYVGRVSRSVVLLSRLNADLARDGLTSEYTHQLADCYLDTEDLPCSNS